MFGIGLANDDSALPTTAPTPAEADPRRGPCGPLSLYALGKVPLLLEAESAARKRAQGTGSPVMQEHSDGVAFLGMYRRGLMLLVVELLKAVISEAM